MWYSYGSYSSHLPVLHPTGGYKDYYQLQYAHKLIEVESGIPTLV